MRCIPSRASLAGQLGLLVILLAASFAGCDRTDGPRVVLYVSADDHIARIVIAAFEAETGITVDFVPDTEATKTTGLANRLFAERDNPPADVFWSSEIFRTIDLARKGVLEAYESETTRQWPAQHRDPQNRWFAFAARARVIVYATDRVAADDAPKTWLDLTQSDHSWSNRIVMADPRYGTTGGHLGAMKAYWTQLAGPTYYDAWLLGLTENGVRVLPSGNAGVVRAVVGGEADVGLTDTDDVWAAQAQGANIAMVYPRHTFGLGDGGGGGTLLIPNTVARVKGGPNPEAAGQLIDFLLSETVERLLAESVSHNIPLRPGLAEDYSQYAVPDPLDVDYGRAADMMQDAIDSAWDALGVGADDDHEG